MNFPWPGYTFVSCAAVFSVHRICLTNRCLIQSFNGVFFLLVNHSNSMISVLWQVTQQEEILESTSTVRVRRPSNPPSPATHTHVQLLMHNPGNCVSTSAHSWNCRDRSSKKASPRKFRSYCHARATLTSVLSHPESWPPDTWVPAARSLQTGQSYLHSSFLTGFLNKFQGSLGLPLMFNCLIISLLTNLKRRETKKGGLNWSCLGSKAPCVLAVLQSRGSFLSQPQSNSLSPWVPPDLLGSHPIKLSSWVRAAREANPKSHRCTFFPSWNSKLFLRSKKYAWVFSHSVLWSSSAPLLLPLNHARWLFCILTVSQNRNDHVPISIVSASSHGKHSSSESGLYFSDLSETAMWSQNQDGNSKPSGLRTSRPNEQTLRAMARRFQKEETLTTMTFIALGRGRDMKVLSRCEQGDFPTCVESTQGTLIICTGNIC